jgi:integrase
MAKRERGEGSVYLRGRVWWVKLYVNGKARPESSGSTKRADAVRLLNRRRGEIASGRYCPDADRVTFEDLAQIIEADYRLQGRRSMPRLQLSLHNLREHFGGERAVQITADRLTTYANARRAEDAALASISAELAALRRAFNLAVRAGRLQSRPHFPTLRVSNARQGFLEEADFHAIVAELPEYLRAPLTFGWLTGWRVRSEVLPMTWAQVDLEAGTARLEQGSTKSGEGREFPIRALPELEQLLLRQREHVRALERKLGCIVGHVFPNNHGRPIMDYAKAWRGACTRAKLPGTLVHDMRRSAVRRLERAGVSRSVAMKLVGHQTESIYRRYAIVSQRDLAEGVGKLAALRASQPAEPGTVIPLRAAR